MTDGKNILDYTGPLDSESIDTLINDFREKNNDLGIKIMIFKKIVTIIIESLENVYKYSKIFQEMFFLPSGHLPKFVLEKHHNKYVITVGNPVRNEDVSNLTSRLDAIKKLNGDELKELYINTIRDGSFSAQGGAGLGFIKIARLANNKFEYHIEPISDGISFFTMTITIMEE